MSTSINVKPIYDSSASSYGSIANPEYAYDNDSSTYAYIFTEKSAKASSTSASYSATAYLHYLMDFSQIPADVEIVGATLHYHAHFSYASGNYKISSRTTTGSIDVCTEGNTIKAATLPGVQVVQDSLALNASEAITWVNSPNPTIMCYGRITAKATTSGQTYTRKVYLKVYDLYAVITYKTGDGVEVKAKVSGEWVSGTIKAKVNNTWEEVTNAFVKVNGNWEEVI